MYKIVAIILSVLFANTFICFKSHAQQEPVDQKQSVIPIYSLILGCSPSGSEVCDGDDNDCNSATVDGSEDPLNGSDCDGSDFDLCPDGTYSCSSGSMVCDDTTSDPEHVEVCNDTRDNDCDGDIDQNDSDCPPPYSHTITIDGANDFIVEDESFSTTSIDYNGYITWDSTYIYIGMEGPDIGSASSNKWVLIYLGGTGGSSTTGFSYSAQTPYLPFSATHHVRWRADNAFTDAQHYSSGWVGAGWNFTGDIGHSGSYLELRIPFADIGITLPAPFQVHISFVNDTGGSEWTYSGIPSISFADGYDPDYSQYYSFENGAVNAPNTYISLP